MPKISSGFYIKARKIQDSDIAHVSPHIREIWDWMLRNANHRPYKTNGTIIGRGQIFTSYSKIQEDLHWKIGYRKLIYKKSQIESATKWLTKAGMITTARTTRGFFITICNYDYYNDISNYENHSEKFTRTTIKPHDIQELENYNSTLVKPSEKNDEKQIPQSNRDNPSWEELYAKRVGESANPKQY